MGILNRLIRIFKADIHGVMDQFEDKGLLLKQYLRDMQDALSEKETCLKQVTVARTQAQRDDENCGLEIEKLEHDLTIAFRKDRDDIARLLIKRIIPLKKLRNDVQQHIDNRSIPIDDRQEKRCPSLIIDIGALLDRLESIVNTADITSQF